MAGIVGHYSRPGLSLSLGLAAATFLTGAGALASYQLRSLAIRGRIDAVR